MPQFASCHPREMSQTDGGSKKWSILSWRPWSKVGKRTASEPKIETTRPLYSANFHCPHCNAPSEIDFGSLLCDHDPDDTGKTFRLPNPREGLQFEHSDSVTISPYNTSEPRITPVIVERLPLREEARSTPRLSLVSRYSGHGKERQPSSTATTFEHPRRPGRPPPELCPPPPGVRTSSSYHVSQSVAAQSTAPLPRSFSESARIECFHEENLSFLPPTTARNIANTRVIPSDAHLRDNDLDLKTQLNYGKQRTPQHANCLQASNYASRCECIVPGPYPSHRVSCSTLPNTASKVALRPSPLKPHRGYRLERIDSMPLASLSGSQSINHDAICNIDKQGVEKIDSALKQPPQLPSRTTSSVYTAGSAGSLLTTQETPPSSPLSVPQRCQSQRDKARLHAEDFRSNLGIIDDVYDLFDDDEKRRKHTAMSHEVPLELSSYGRHLDDTDHSFHVNHSLTQKSTLELADEIHDSRSTSFDVEPARNKAARALVGDSIGTEELYNDCVRWLNTTTANSLDQTGTDVEKTAFSEHQQSTRMSQSSIDRRLSRDRFAEGETNARSAAHQYSWHIASEAISKPIHGSVDEMHPSQRHTTEPEASLSIVADADSDSDSGWSWLRSRLEDLSTGYGQTNIDTTQRLENAAATSDSICSRDLDEESRVYPLTLQRVEIIWNGKRVPVLIGDGGKLWEAPCMNADCREHGQKRRP